MYKVRLHDGLNTVVYTTNSLADAERKCTQVNGWIEMPSDGGILQEHIDMQEKWYN